MNSGAAISPNREIRALTGVRGIAACYVLVYHALYHTDIPGPLGIAARHGYLSVDLFFVLSGFVLGLNHGQAFASRFSMPEYAAFWQKRIARVYPLYLVVSLAMFHMARVGVIYPISNLLLIQSWMLAPSINGAAWSISVEWFAYATFPLLAWLALGRSHRMALLLTVMSFSLLALIATLPSPAIRGVYAIGPLDLGWWGSPGPLIRCVTEFSLGLLTFRFARLTGPPAPHRRAACQIILTAAILILGLIPQSDLAIVALVPPLVWSLVTDRGPVASVLASPPVHYLGVLSYSIYLLHPMFLPLGELATRFIPNEPLAVRVVVTAGAVLLPVTATAVLAYHAIERRGRRLVLAVFDRLFPRPLPGAF